MGTLAVKLLGTVSQLILAFLLSKSDFGEIGLTYTVTAFVTLIVNPGIGEAIVRRGLLGRRWVTPAFWLVMANGMMGAVLVLCVSPLAAIAYDEPRLVPLLAIAAIGMPLASLLVVPNALLQANLRFRFIAANQIVQSLLTVTLTIFFAWAGFGAYSFLLPQPIVNLIGATVLWMAARPRIHARLHVRRWRYLLPDAYAFSGVRLVWTILGQGDYIVLGLLASRDEVGLYFFSFLFSTQAIRLAAGNVYSVLFSTLSLMRDDPRRQAEAAEKSARLMMFAVAPLCVLQGVLAEPLLHLLYGTAWSAAILPVTVLSCGFALYCPLFVAEALIHSQGKFSVYYKTMGASAVLFLAAATTGAWMNEARGTAIAVAIYYIHVPVLAACILFRAGGFQTSHLLRIYIKPLCLTLLALGCAIVAKFSLSLVTASHGVTAFAIAFCFTATYLAAATIVAPEAVSEAKTRCLSLLRFKSIVA